MKLNNIIVMSQILVLVFILYFTLGVISFIAFMKSLRLGVDLWNKKKKILIPKLYYTVY